MPSMEMILLKPGEASYRQESKSVAIAGFTLKFLGSNVLRRENDVGTDDAKN